MTSQNKILVIKLSALGDFIIALGAMHAIREHHKNDHVTLLTTKPYKALAEKSGYFDKVIIDKRPKFYAFRKWLKLRKFLNSQKFSTVYDLQINDRTALYYKLFSKKPEWVGALKKSDRDKSGLAFHRHKRLLEKAGIENIEVDKLDWMKGNIGQFKLEEPYALIVPGCAPSRPEKRWPALNYASLCKKLISKNIRTVLIGTKDEANILEEIAQNVPETLNLMGQTSLYDIVSLARNAKLAIGNDTGPMHIIGPTDCPSFILFSGSSDPEKHAPLGDHIQTMKKDNIADISVDEAFKKIKNLI